MRLIRKMDRRIITLITVLLLSLCTFFGTCSFAALAVRAAGTSHYTGEGSRTLRAQATKKKKKNKNKNNQNNSQNSSQNNNQNSNLNNNQNNNLTNNQKTAEEMKILEEIKQIDNNEWVIFNEDTEPQKNADKVKKNDISHNRIL